MADPISWLTSLFAATGTTGGAAAGTGVAAGATGTAIGDAALASSLGTLAATTAAPVVTGAGVSQGILGAQLAGLAGGTTKALAPSVLSTGLAAGLMPGIKLPKGPQIPTRDLARESQALQDRLRRKRGGAANILTGTLGDPTAPQTASKVLLGQ